MGAIPAVTGRHEWTQEQLEAITRRDGDLLLDAGAGSGKTSVLVERFVRSVLEDDVDVQAILAITFTEKAAAELRDRIRLRLRDLGAVDAARATEGAFISTIHGLCARILRIHALGAGIDPRFEVLDALGAQRLADAAFDDALDDLGREHPGGLELIAAYTAGGLRGAILSTYAELRSRGELHPRLPALGPPPDLEGARRELLEAAAAAARELGEIDSPPARVAEALDRLERCSEVLEALEPWPGALGPLALPGGNGAALSTPVCQEYESALGRFRLACEHRWAGRIHGLLDTLLGGFGERYAERKHDASALDFADLELKALDLLRRDSELRDRLRSRFVRIMVDELQDTNRVQLDLIEQLSAENLFTVGDAQQSIYGFRHADVELFEARGQQLEAVGCRATLQTNFRSRPEILDVLNRAFAEELGDRFRPLHPGRVGGGEAQGGADPPTPRVELLVTDKGAEWESEALASPWRVAEARALADRLDELTRGGTSPGDVVVLLRAATDMRVYERALEQRGIPTYVIGGRGYWSHPQVVDIVAYLRALANPRDGEALYTLLVSPLLGVSLDTLVVLADASRAADRDPWWLLQEPEGRLDELEAGEREKLGRFADWFACERRASARLGVEQLIDRALDQTGYDDTVLAMPGGERRLANLRKLMRLGREQDSTAGDPLRSFLELVRFRSVGWSAGDASEGEAPVESEGLDAVRMMTIHRAKGLEFDVVCVADLGRAPRGRAELMRVGRDGRFGLRLAQPGTGRREPALDYKSLGDVQLQSEAREERRLFYVAMTRARELLILSGAAKLDAWPTGPGGGPVAWIAPALVPEMAARASERRSGAHHGVKVEFVCAPEERPTGGTPSPGPGARTPPAAPARPPNLPSLPAPPPAAHFPAVTEISYSSLEEHRRCGYRFYVERVLALPPLEPGGHSIGVEVEPPQAGPDSPGRLGAAERGILVHALLERLDYRRPVVPDAEAILKVAEIALSGQREPSSEEREEIIALLTRFAGGELCARLGRATGVRSEQRFSFLLGAAGARADPGGEEQTARASPAIMIRGVFDAIAQERDGRILVVDYKTDRIADADPEAVVTESYATQRVIYGLAALRTGARQVEVLHAFLERPEDPVAARFEAADTVALEAELGKLAGNLLDDEFRVTQSPHRSVCHGCPAEGGLCSWPLSATRRTAPDRLF